MSSDEQFVVEVLRALRSVRLEAIFVGNMAAIMQGAPVTPQTVDVLVRDTPANRAKIERFAKALGRGRPALITELTRTLRLIGTTGISIDVLFDAIAGELSFASLRRRSVKVPVGDEIAIVASLEDVIASKTAAGRPKDLAVLPILRDTLRVKWALENAE